MCHPDTGNGNGSIPSTAARERRFDVETAGTSLPVFEAAPDGRSRGNVLIVHDVYGANDNYHNLARRFASAGYTAYLPDLFVRQGPLPEQTREAAFARREKWSTAQAVDDVKRAVDEIQRVSTGKVGTVGFCMGGTMVMLLAVREPRIACGAIYYGFPANRTEDRGETFFPMEEVSRVQQPLLGFWGDQDHGVGMDNVEQYRQQLAAAGKTFDFTIYPGPGHGFLTFDASSPNYAASQDSYQKMLAFYGDYLAG
jgi:carboxymethylenebutenolidase